MDTDIVLWRRFITSFSEQKMAACAISFLISDLLIAQEAMLSAPRSSRAGSEWLM